MGGTCKGTDMKNLFVASALLLGTSVVAIGAAQAGDFTNNTYISVLGGPTFAPGLNVSGTKNGMDTGFNVGARAGYYLDNWNLPNVSVEADWMLNQSSYSGFSNARLQSSSYMGNLIYHLPVDESFQVYGGAGLGAVDTNIDNGLGNHGGSTQPAWQDLGRGASPAAEQTRLSP